MKMFSRLKAVFNSDSEDETNKENGTENEPAEKRPDDHTGSVTTYGGSSSPSDNVGATGPESLAAERDSLNDKIEDETRHIDSKKEAESDGSGSEYDIISIKDTDVSCVVDQSAGAGGDKIDSISHSADSKVFNVQELTVDKQPRENRVSTANLGQDPKTEYAYVIGDGNDTSGIANAAFEPSADDISTLLVAAARPHIGEGEFNAKSMDPENDTQPMLATDDNDDDDTSATVMTEANDEYYPGSDLSDPNGELAHYLNGNITQTRDGHDELLNGALAGLVQGESKEPYHPPGEDDVQTTMFSWRGADHLAKSNVASETEEDASATPTITIKDVVNCMVDPMTNKVIGDGHDSGVESESEEVFVGKVVNMLTKQSENRPVHENLLNSITERIPIFRNLLEAHVQPDHLEEREVAVQTRQMRSLPGQGSPESLPVEERDVLTLLREMIRQQDQTLTEPFGLFQQAVKGKLESCKYSVRVGANPKPTLIDYSHSLKVEELMACWQSLLVLKRKLLDWWRAHMELVPEEKISNMRGVAVGMCELSQQFSLNWRQYMSKHEGVAVFYKQKSYNQEVEAQINKLHDFIAAMLLQLRIVLAIVDSEDDAKDALRQDKINFEAIDRIIIQLPDPYMVV